MQSNGVKLFIIKAIKCASPLACRRRSCRNIDSSLLFSTLSIQALTGLLCGICIVTSSPVQAEVTGQSSSAKITTPIDAVVSPSNDVVNLQFQGREAWDYDLERPNPSTISLRLPKLSETSKANLQKFHSAWVARVEVQNTSSESDTLLIHLERPDIQSFDYMTDQPSRLVVDLFVPDDQPAKAPAKSKVASKVMATKKVVVAATKKEEKASRAPASLGSNAKAIEESGAEANGIADAGDPNLQRFAIKDYNIDPKAAIAAERNIYVRFPVLKLDSPQLHEMLKAQPIYEIKPENNDENKQAQLIEGLYEKHRLGLVFRTLDLFHKAYPNSKYNEILGYIEADSHYEIYLKDRGPEEFDKAIALYQKAVQAYPESLLRKRTILLIGYSQLDRGQSLNVIKTLQNFVQNYSTAPERFPAQLAMADAYLKLNRFEEARKIYDDLEADKQSGDVGIEAAYLRGDTYMTENQLAAAIKEYRKAETTYPTQWKKYPNAFYNRAEALFLEKKYKDALDGYREFLQRFPSSEHGGYAMTRIGECLEILGAPHQKVVGAYLEGIFRYRNTGGANFATIRVLKERMPEMKPKEVEKAIEEVRELEKHSTLPLLDDFVTVAIADGYVNRNEPERALKTWIDFYQANPTTESQAVIRSRIVQVICSQVHDAAEKGDSIAAMQIYGKYASTWLKNVNRIDLSYDMALAFEKAGVPAEADRRYAGALALLRQSQKDGTIHEREVFEKVPTAESIQLRLAAVNIFAGKGERAREFLSDIKDLKKLTSTQKSEWIELNASLNEQTGQLSAAVKFLKDMIEKTKDDKDQRASLYIRLAGIEMKSKNYKGAEEAYDQAANLLETPDEVDLRLADVLNQKAQLYERTNQTQKAIGAYKDLLERFGDDHPYGSERYQLGKLYFKNGEVKAAQDAWNNLNKPETQFWYKLSQEQMNDSKWKDDYRRYLDKIPTMAGRKASADREPAQSADDKAKGSAPDSQQSAGGK